MTSVTLILDTFDPAKHNQPLGEFEMPWGQIGNLVFRIQRKDNPTPTVMNSIEEQVASRVEKLIANYMMKYWENFNTQNSPLDERAV